MWQLSRKSRHTKDMINGYKPDWSSIRDRVNESISVKGRHFTKQLNELTSDVKYSYKEDGGGGKVSVFNGYATFESDNVLSISNNNGNSTTKIKCDNIVVATGSKPRGTGRNNIEADGVNILTTDDILKLDEFPESLLIYGAGIIGCEYAAIFSNFGVTRDIYLFNENKPRLLPNEDDDLSEYLTYNLQSESDVTVINGCPMNSIVYDKTKNKVICTYDNDKIIEVDKVLLAIGRIPNLSHLKLENVGINLNKNGYLNDDEIHCNVTAKDATKKLCHINHQNIHFIGDCLGKYGLVSVAEMESRYTMEVICGTKNPITKLKYDNISSIIFVRPEMSCVGLNENECKRRNIPYKSCLLRLGLMNRSIIDFNERWTLNKSIAPKKAGFIKMVAADDDDKVLLGMRAVGVNSSNVIQTASLLIRNKSSIREFEKIAFPHPSITESIQECARMLLGRSIYKPHIWPRSYVKHWTPIKGEAFAEEIISKGFRQTIPGYME